MIRGVKAVYREEPCRSALNRVRGMPFDWSLNPYMGCSHRCAFCYVRGFERRADRPSGAEYGRSIRVKVNVVEVLRRELAGRAWRGEGVAIGAATDPYQPAEGRYRLTRGCLEALAAAANPFSLITRSPLVVRDAELLAHAAGRAEVSVAFSVPTLDEDVWRVTEPGTAPPRQRLRALRVLVEAGVHTTVAMAPILPGLSDRPEQLAAVVGAAREAGACGIWGIPLNLRPGTREHFLAAVADAWPELLPRYERLYAGRAYLPGAHAAALRTTVAGLAREHGIADRRPRPAKPPLPPRQLALEIREIPARPAKSG
jgi:DNA repair photolyase